MIQINVTVREHKVRTTLDSQSKWWIDCACGWTRGAYSADMIRMVAKQHAKTSRRLDLVVT